METKNKAIVVIVLLLISLTKKEAIYVNILLTIFIIKKIYFIISEFKHWFTIQQNRLFKKQKTKTPFFINKKLETKDKNERQRQRWESLLLESNYTNSIAITPSETGRRNFELNFINCG